MINTTVYNCPACMALNTAILPATTLLVCQNCHGIVVDHVKNNSKPKPVHIPPDWSFVQLQTTGEYQKQPFTVIGRLRLQLRNDYKNIWCAVLPDGKNIWLVESFGGFLVLGSAWHTYKDGVSKLRAGIIITPSKDLKLRGEYVEKCEGISYEGELADWRLFFTGFFLIQAADTNDQVALFIVDGRTNEIEYLSGMKIEHEKLNLKNSITWDEWK